MTEKDLNKESIEKHNLYESTMNRVMGWIKNYECAILTAWRNRYTDVTDNTFIPTHIHFNRKLYAALLRLGYGVTNIRECSKQEEQEDSFLVVNLNDDTDFKSNIFTLSDYYDQDSFMYSPKGSDEGILIGTNDAEFPGYGNQIPSGKFHRDVQSLFMSRIGNKGLSFSNGESISKDDAKRNDKLSDDEMNNYATEPVESILQIDTFDRYNINGKHAISLCSAPHLRQILS